MEQTHHPYRRPWADLPPAVADAIRPVVPALADEIIAAVRDEVPDYARPFEGAFGRGMRAGVDEALRWFVEAIAGTGGDRAGDGDEPGRAAAAVYVGLGRAELR